MKDGENNGRIFFSLLWQREAASRDGRRYVSELYHSILNNLISNTSYLIFLPFFPAVLSGRNLGNGR